MVKAGQVDYETLTDREQEILGLIAEGLSNQQIADQLFLTLGTVKWYNKQIYQKLNVRSRTQATLRARESGLLGVPAPAIKHNLPPQTTLFIGREPELAGIQRRMADPACRMLTLIGPGGIGKTRLALEASRLVLKDFPDGVFFVSFAPVESPEFIGQTLADGLELKHSDQLDPLGQVIRYVRDKSLLLVIDNFEHLLGGIYSLHEILVRSSHVKLLVTSRERLQLKEEWIFDVHGLYYPEIGSGGQSHLDLAAYEAGQLFLQTAQRARSDFSPDENDQVQVARICQYVEGMPLGIELAASWVRLLSCEEIADQIMHSLDILTTSWRDIPDRHRSLRVVLDHSWKLLTEEERAVFCRLTVFASSFGLRAAGAVAGASLMMLLELVDKSFLHRMEEEYFGIHSLVKQYGSEKQQADPTQWAASRLQHCRFHAAFLNELMGASDPHERLADATKVFDDLQSAWRYAVENELLAEIEQLSAGFLSYYKMHSWYRAGSGALDLYQKALACYDEETNNVEQRTAIACLYESIGELQELSTAHEGALRAFDQALEYTAADAFIQRGRLFGRIADIWVAKNQHDQGHAFYTQAEGVLEGARSRDAAWWEEWLDIQLRRLQLYYWQNRPDDMAKTASKIGPLVEWYGSGKQRLGFLYTMEGLALRRHDYFHSSEAIKYTGEALKLSLESGNLGEIAYGHFSYGFSHLWSDHYDEAEKHMQIARQMSEESGDLTLLTRALAYLAFVHRKRGDVEQTRAYAVSTLRMAEETRMPQYAGMAYSHYAWLAWCSGDLVETKRQAETAIKIWGGLNYTQDSIPFYWMLLLPLIGTALQEEEIEKAVDYAQHLLTPPQQRLPDTLAGRLNEAINAWNTGHQPETNDLLRQAFQLAHEMGYV